MREPDLQRITFLGFEIFKIFQDFKTTFGYYLSNFCVLVSFQAKVLFLYQRIKVQKRKLARKTFRYFSFLSKIIEKMYIHWEDDQQIQLILPAKFSMDKRRFLFPRQRKMRQYCTLYHIPFNIKKFQYTFFIFLSKQCMTSAVKGHEKSHFLRSLLQIRCSQICLIFTRNHLCWSLFLFNLQARRCFPVKFVQNFKNTFFHRTSPVAASVIFK